MHVMDEDIKDKIGFARGYVEARHRGVNNGFSYNPEPENLAGCLDNLLTTTGERMSSEPIARGIPDPYFREFYERLCKGRRDATGGAYVKEIGTALRVMSADLIMNKDKDVKNRRGVLLSEFVNFARRIQNEALQEKEEKEKKVTETLSV